MELSKFESGIVVHNEEIKHVIVRDNFYVMHEDNYSYTVGMRNIGGPELVIYGERRAVAEEMFRIVYDAALLKHGKLDVKNLVNDIFEPAPVFTEMDEVDKKDVFFAARTYYGDWTFSAFVVSNCSMKGNQYAI